MERLYIRVDEASSGAVQEVLFGMGVFWNSGDREVMYRRESLLVVAMCGSVPALFVGEAERATSQTLDLRGTGDV